MIKNRLLSALLGALLIVTFAGVSYAAKNESSHMKKTMNIDGCSACHSGRGVGGGGLLKARSEELCYRCHGYNTIVRGRSGVDIQTPIRQFSSHPVEETSHLHRNGEELPPRDSFAPRHVACADCHISHVTQPGKAWNGIPGYRPSGVRGVGMGLMPAGIHLKRADNEYELCYRCHSDGANMPMGSRDISAEFDPSNMSYHPVETSGRNKNVPSLVTELTENSILKCSSCHGNGDPNGAVGPHGSEFAPILLAEYRQQDGPESPMSYTLCYLCHDRMSILRDDSFKSHNYHIALNAIACSQCHNAHGSKMNGNLIDFDPIEVTPPSDGMGPLYIEGIPGMPKCYLTCHSADHNTTGINGKPWPW